MLADPRRAPCWVRMEVIQKYIISRGRDPLKMLQWLHNIGYDVYAQALVPPERFQTFMDSHPGGVDVTLQRRSVFFFVVLFLHWLDSAMVRMAAAATRREILPSAGVLESDGQSFGRLSRLVVVFLL